jgi:hypothetical protein
MIYTGLNLTSNIKPGKIYITAFNDDWYQSHRKVQYKKGINTLENNITINSSNLLEYGFHFTILEEIDYLYSLGTWVAIVKIPDDAQVLDMYNEGTQWKTNKMIVDEIYNLYDLETIIKLETIGTFKFPFSPFYISQVCFHGNTDILDYWVGEANVYLEYDEWTMNFASYQGHVNVLEWFFKSGLPVKYNWCAIDYACIGGHVNVLEWWKNSKLPLQYTSNALHHATYHGHLNVLNWWKNSKLPLKHLGMAMLLVGDKYTKNSIYNWWKTLESETNTPIHIV